MDRSLNEAARDIGRAIEQLRETMVAKGYPEAQAHISIDGPYEFAVWLRAYKSGAFHNGLLSYAHCSGDTLGEAYTKADQAIAAMPDRAAERAAS